MSKILKFGIICEDNNGNLVFSAFHIDGENSPESSAVITLEAVIDRLNQELAKQRRTKSSHAVDMGRG